MGSYLLEREQEIIHARDEDGLKFKEIAKRYGICSSRARAIYINAKAKDRSAQNDELEALILNYTDQVQAIRIMTCLNRDKITTVDQLKALDENEIRRIRNIGAKSAETLLKVREEIGG